MSELPHPSLTALDTVLIAMAAQPDDPAARLAVHAELSRSEMFVLLEAEVSGDTMRPRVFDLSEARAVLAFDSELRLAEFAGQAAAYAALPGRVLVQMLVNSPEPLALLLNADADHAGFLPHEALLWLTQTLDTPEPAQAEARVQRFLPPDLPPAVAQVLIPALERRLSGMPGLDAVVLAGAEWENGTRGHVLALSGLPDAAHAPVARAVTEALTLSGIEAGALDVIFPSETAMAPIAKAGQGLTPEPFEMPEDQTITPGANPGLDPNRPPKLK